MTRRISGIVGAALLAQLAALVCLAIGFAKRNDVGFQGAYFDRDPGGTLGSVSVWHVTATPWLIAAGILLVIGLLLFIAATTSLRGRPS